MSDYANDFDMQEESDEDQDPSLMSPTTRYLKTGYSEVLSAKRKSDESASSVTSTGPSGLEASLNYIRSTLRSAANATRIGSGKSTDPGFHRIASLLADVGKVLDSLLTKKGKLVSPPESPTQKKSKCSEREPSGQKPTMVDASTDTILTPNWWDSEGATAGKTASRRKKNTRPTGTGTLSKPIDTEVESAMETDAENWSTVVRKQPRVAKVASTVTRGVPTVGRPQPKAFSKKPPAVLVKPSEGKTFAETVRTIRSCGLSAQEIGANVTMRETRDGSLLMELPKGAKSSAAAKTIASAISTKLGDSVGKVIQLGVQVEVEIVDLDAVSSAAEVLEALRAAFPGDDPAATAEREAISDVRIWPVRAGQQVATAKMSRHAASLITKIPVGWTMCRVRPRSHPPERCFKCQAFGHNSRSCTGPDRTGACWRCGVIGHLLKDCKAPDDSCLACELAGLPKTGHRPGSGACAARRLAASAKSVQ